MTKIQDIATKDDLFNLNTGLVAYLRKTKSDLIKWMFVFWITQEAATVVVMLLIKK